MINYLNDIARYLLPYRCLLCADTADANWDLCAACAKDLPILPHTCIYCANILHASPSNPVICGTCLRHKPPFDQLYAAYLYQPPITKLIWDLKFNGVLTHARLLGELLAKKILDNWYVKQRLPEAIIPIPLHENRLQERGFNQSIEIARPIAKQLNIPLLLNHSIRQKPTLAQSSLSRAERQTNVKQVFKLIKPIPHYVAVIDDVVTTSATVTEFCLLLKQQGVEKIDVWCSARAHLSSQ